MKNFPTNKLYLGALALFALLSLAMSNVLIDSIAIINFSQKIYTSKTPRFVLESSDLNFTLNDFINQRIIRKQRTPQGKSIVLETGLFPAKNVETPLALQQFLIDTQFLNLHNSKLLVIAEQFKNVPSDKIISAVEHFVFNYISVKSSGIPFMAAKDIIISKEGDCTEHTILAIAIFRALKIPARAVVGMYLSEEWLGKKNIFVYHMWAEAYVNNSWHLVEAAMNRKLPNRYIAFTFHNLQTSIPISYLKVISAIKDLKVTYISE